MPQSLASVHVHIVFGTKHRRPFLSDDETRTQMHAYIASILKAYDSPPVIVGGPDDHVHILCLLSRNHSISKVIAEIKRNSTKWIKTKGADYKEFSWQNGYGVFSVGKSMVDKTIKYIKNQKEHHAEVDFKGEMIGFLKKHGVAYDEKYLWD